MPPLSIMIKPASSLCNLRCKYCFYCDVAANREVFSLGKMNEATAEKLIKDALSFAEGSSVAFAFQGGEPLLAGMDYFKFFTEAVKKYNTKGSEIYYSLQTNGTLINDEWARFFTENKFLIGLSLDGDYEGNKFRVDANGQNSYYKIITAANKLKKHKTEFNILTVLTGYCAENAERIYKYFRSQGFGYLQAYTAPLQMGFICVASVLIGGATTTKATIMNVLIGTFLYQGLIIFTPPVSNHLLAGTDISDTMRQIIQNGVILYALAQAKGGSD